MILPLSTETTTTALAATLLVMKTSEFGVANEVVGQAPMTLGDESGVGRVATMSPSST